MDESNEAWQRRLARRRDDQTPWTTIAAEEGIHVNTFRDGRKRAERKGWLPPESQLPPAVRSDGRRVGAPVHPKAQASTQENPRPEDVVEVLPGQMRLDEKDTAAASALAEIVPVNTDVVPLSPDEAQTLAHYEQIISQGIKTFVQVGQALLAIRDQRLYRESHATFEDYLRQRWDLGRAHAYRMIEAAVVVENLSPIGDIIPMNEAQARPLTTLPPDQQREVWHEAVETAPPSGVTAKHVKETVKRVKARTATPKAPVPTPQPKRQARIEVQDGLVTLLKTIPDHEAWPILGEFALSLDRYVAPRAETSIGQDMAKQLASLWTIIQEHELDQVEMSPITEGWDSPKRSHDGNQTHTDEDAN